MEKLAEKISILSTGGTINGKRSRETDVIDISLPSSTNEQQWVNSLSSNVKIGSVKTISSLLSEDIEPKDWIDIANEVVKAINEGSYGVVITHGTYTMSYTAAALSFMLKNLNVPVILTGAQIPKDEENSDAAINVRAAMKVANYENSPAEVCAVFSGSMDSAVSYFGDSGKVIKQYPSSELVFIYRGVRLRKGHTWRYDCFQSVNEKPIGRVIKDKIEFDPTLIRAKRKSDASDKVYADTRLDTRVMLLKSFPGMDPSILDELVDKKKYRGIIIEAYPDGTMSTRKDSNFSFIPAIKHSVEERIPVFLTSQSIGEIKTAYATGRRLIEAGVVPLKDITTEAALPKLMWVLGHTSDPKEAKDLMLKNIAGEMYEEVKKVVST